MKIAIDCRLIGQSGIGTFIENVMHYMVERTDMYFVLVGDKKRLEPYALRETCTIVECNYPSFSLKELFVSRQKKLTVAMHSLRPFSIYL